jgi:hypothetical protein
MLPLSSRQALQEEQKAADAEAAAATAAAAAAEALRARGDAAFRRCVTPRATLTAHPEVDDEDDDGDDDEAEDFAAAHLGFAHRMAGSINCGPVRGGTAITSYPPNN